VAVTLAGSSFLTGATVAVSNVGVTVSNVSVVSASQITATFTIAANATTGAANVTVSTSGGTSAAVPFTISLAPPTLSAISPSSGIPGSNYSVTLTGTRFVSGATVATTSPDITVSSVVVVSSTQITANFAISATATLGNFNVTVSTSGGTSAPVSFGITAAPVFTPIRINAGSSTAYTDPLGQVWSPDSNFTGGGAVSNTNPVTGTPAPALYQTGHYGPVSGTPLTYQFTVPNGSYTVNLKFDENAATQAGQRVFNVVINGQTVLPNFDIYARAGAQFQAVDAVVPVTVTNGQINIQFVSVVYNTRVCAIEILGGTPAAPTVTAISPNSGSAGASVPVTLTGTNLNSDLVINAGSKVAVSNVTVVSATQVTATFTVASGTSGTTANVTVTTAGGTTGPQAFTVQ
jgi:hypothetical protein